MTSQHLQLIRVQGLAPAMGHYSDAVLAGSTLYITGVTAHDSAGDLRGQDDVAEQSRQIFENLGLVLSAAGASPGDVARVTVYMVDVRERAKMNAARRDFFGEHRPASTLLQVSGLVEPEVLVEIEAIAVLPR
jgi:reactive intermediate/imine deaminase